MTFVYREVQALRAAGLDVETFSIRTPSPNELSEESKGFVDETFYVFPLKWPQFLLSHAYYLFTRPRRYLGSLWYCVMHKHKTLWNRVRTFLHFCEAVYMAKDVERKRIKHLHAHFVSNATTLAMVASRLTDITFSFTAHANDIYVNPILLPEKIRAAQFIIAISQYNERALHDAVPTQDTLNKMHLVRYCIDVQRFSPPTERPRNNPPMILAVSRLVEKKGLPYLIEACNILAVNGREFRCMIVGAGPQEDLLQKLIAEHNLSKHVTLEGVVFQEGLKQYLSKADMFVLPCIVASDGDIDGIPNTLMEAMAMEIATISTTVSGIPELIEDMKTGLAVPPEDGESLATAIATLLDDQELRDRLGKAGRLKVAEDFEIEKNANRLLAVFNQYVAS